MKISAQSVQNLALHLSKRRRRRNKHAPIRILKPLPGFQKQKLKSSGRFSVHPYQSTEKTNTFWATENFPDMLILDRKSISEMAMETKWLRTQNDHYGSTSRLYDAQHPAWADIVGRWSQFQVRWRLCVCLIQDLSVIFQSLANYEKMNSEI